MIFDSLLKIIDKKLSSGVSQSEGLQYICQLLFDHIEHYDWVGYYLHNQEKDVIVSLVSPYIDQREAFKKALGEDIVEIYVHTSEARDRDHYKAEAYNSPRENFIDIDTTDDTPEESLQKIINALNG